MNVWVLAVINMALVVIAAPQHRRNIGGWQAIRAKYRSE
jgi:hypothetical protein